MEILCNIVQHLAVSVQLCIKPKIIPPLWPFTRTEQRWVCWIYEWWYSVCFDKTWYLSFCVQLRERERERERICISWKQHNVALPNECVSHLCCQSVTIPSLWPVITCYLWMTVAVPSVRPVIPRYLSVTTLCRSSLILSSASSLQLVFGSISVMETSSTWKLTMAPLGRRYI